MRHFTSAFKVLLLGLMLCAMLVSIAACMVVPDMSSSSTTSSSSDTSNTTTSTTTVRPSPQYIVTFDGNTSAGDVTEKVVFEGFTVTPPATPENENHIFLGWYLGENKFDFSTPITEDITLVAKWKENVYYTVIFKDGSTELSTQQVLENTGAVAPTAPQKPGMAFFGWDKDFSHVTSDMVIYAQYTPITYKVNFDTAGGTSIPSVVVGEAKLSLVRLILCA